MGRGTQLGKGLEVEGRWGQWEMSRGWGCFVSDPEGHCKELGPFC